MKPLSRISELFLVGLAVLLLIGGTSFPSFAAPPAQAPGVAPLIEADNANAIPRQYIVVLNQATPVEDVRVQARLAESAGGEIHFTYTSALKGYSATLDDNALARVRQQPNIAYIAADQVVRLSQNELQPTASAAPETAQPNPTWGLDRIDQRGLPLDHAYNYALTGAGINVYVIDTGIRVTHVEFGGRAHSGYTAINDGNGTNDCNGHGTHVAGTIGSTTYGVAKAVQLYAVRVLDCDGLGEFSGVIAGVDWVTANKVAPAVVNMSLGGGAYTPLDDAIKNSTAAGLTYVVAAGNAQDNACFYSPARAPEAITVGATDADDVGGYFTNYGTCVALFAPGVAILSTSNVSDSATATMSGTSMASPHVAGVVALLLQSNAALTPAQAKSIVVNSATVGHLTSIGPNSPNRLLYTNSENDITIDSVSVTTTNGQTKPVYAPGETIRTTFVTTNHTASSRTAFPVWSILKNDGTCVTGLCYDPGQPGTVFPPGQKTFSHDFVLPANLPTGLYTFRASLVVSYNGSDSLFQDSTRFRAGVPPANDEIDNATVITDETSDTFHFTTSGNTLEATSANDDPGLPCSASGAPAGSASVWYKFTPPVGGIVTVDTRGTDYDTILGIWSGARGALQNVACNDDTSIEDFTSQVTAELTNGTTYYIEVVDYALAGMNSASKPHAISPAVPGSPSSGGTLILTLDFVPTTVPPNDEIENAIPISSDTFAITQNTLAATSATDDPSFPCAVGGARPGFASVWYKFVPSQDGRISVNTVGSSYNALLGIWTGSRGALNNVACDNDDSGAQTAFISAAAVREGVTYYLEAAAVASGNTSQQDQGKAQNVFAGGNLHLNFSLIVPLPNDEFENALDITSSPFAITQDTLKAFPAPDDPTFPCSGNGPRQGSATVWFKYVPSTGGALDAGTAGTNYDTLLGVWTGTRGALSNVACDDDGGGGSLTSALHGIYLISGGTYYIEVASYAMGSSSISAKQDSPEALAIGGNLNFTLTFSPGSPAQPVQLKPLPKSTTTKKKIKLNWSDSPGATIYHIEVRRKKPGAPVLAATNTVSKYMVKHLIPGAVYLWRVNACDSASLCSEWTDWWKFKAAAP